MAKKVVASLQTEGNKYSKVIKMIKHPKTNHYYFKECIIPKEDVEEFLKNTK